MRQLQIDFLVAFASFQEQFVVVSFLPFSVGEGLFSNPGGARTDTLGSFGRIWGSKGHTKKLCFWGWGFFLDRAELIVLLTYSK